MLPNNGYIEIKVDDKPLRVEWYRSNPRARNAQFNVYVSETVNEVIQKRNHRRPTSIRRSVIHEQLFDQSEQQTRSCLLKWQSRAKV